VGNPICEFIVKWMGNGMANEIKLEKRLKTHILGNGNSVKYFTDDGCMSIVACNIPQHGHRFTDLSIIDAQPVVAMKNTGWRTNRPIWCSRKTARAAENHGVDGDFRQAYDDEYRTNSAHWAARLFLCYTDEVIHLWGIDSLFSDDLTSQMDSIVPRRQRPDLNKHWHPHWQKIFARRPELKWVIHTPVGVKLRVKAPNVKQKTHEICHSTSLLAPKA
jgi:hypothetical protein